MDTHLLKCPRSRTLTPRDAGEDVEQQELSFVVGGNEKGTATLEDKLVVSYKTKHVLTIQSDNHIPWYLRK